TTRGGPEPDVPPTAASARLGARSTDLALAIRSGDRAAIRLLVADMTATLVAAGVYGISYQAIADSTDWTQAKQLEVLRDMYADLKQALVADYLGVGGWAEAARLATRAQDAAFFRTPETRMALDRAGALRGLDADGRAAVERLTRLTASAQVQDWSSIDDALYELLHSIAR
ncbi:MAG TPA: hypothetical protein VJT67_11150, partial [Longimicrobiaceae bacterium]|nr:hypothetical protein [Longimicrobiaceae bacterium]